MSATFTSSLACLAALCVPVTAVAQAHVHPSGDNSARERHSIRATRADVAPKSDGALDDAVWPKAPITTPGALLTRPTANSR